MFQIQTLTHVTRLVLFLFFTKKGGTICPDSLQAYPEALQEIWWGYMEKKAWTSNLTRQIRFMSTKRWSQQTNVISTTSVSIPSEKLRN